MTMAMCGALPWKACNGGVGGGGRIADACRLDNGTCVRAKKKKSPNAIGSKYAARNGMENVENRQARYDCTGRWRLSKKKKKQRMLDTRKQHIDTCGAVQ